MNKIKSGYQAVHVQGSAEKVSNPAGGEGGGVESEEGAMDSASHYPLLFFSLCPPSLVASSLSYHISLLSSLLLLHTPSPLATFNTHLCPPFRLSDTCGLELLQSSSAPPPLFIFLLLLLRNFPFFLSVFPCRHSPTLVINLTPQVHHVRSNSGFRLRVHSCQKPWHQRGIGQSMLITYIIVVFFFSLIETIIPDSISF